MRLYSVFESREQGDEMKSTAKTIVLWLVLLVTAVLLYNVLAARS
jgi:hypothetical protein